MIVLTEPLNASLIAMTVVHKEAPSRRTVIGVSVVLVGCAVVLWNSSREGKQASNLERELEREVARTTAPTASVRRMLQQRVSMTQQWWRSMQVVLLSTIGTYAPDITAKAGWRDSRFTKRVMRRSLMPHMLWEIGMSSRKRNIVYFSVRRQYQSQFKSQFKTPYHAIQLSSEYLWYHWGRRARRGWILIATTRGHVKSIIQVQWQPTS